MKTLRDYLGLLARQHAEKPKYRALVSACVRLFLDSQAFAKSAGTAFDIDTAAGVQLDQVGEWIGITRAIHTPMAGVYFTFDGGPGFDRGILRGRFDPLTGLELLPDGYYRQILKARIIYNGWNGSIPQATKGLKAAFPAAVLIMQTYPGTAIVYGLYGGLTPIEKAIFDQGYFDFRPAGVAFKRHFTTSVPVFAFDAQGVATAGLNSGILI